MAILITVLIATPIQAEKVKFYKKDNVLIGINFNDGPGSSDMTLIMRLSGDNDIYVDEGNDVKYIHSPDNENQSVSGSGDATLRLSDVVRSPQSVDCLDRSLVGPQGAAPQQVSGIG